MPPQLKRRPRQPRPISLPPTPPVEELLAQDLHKRAEACQAQLAAVLKRHNCRLQALVTIVDGNTQSQVAVVAQPAAGPKPRAS